jgi:CheY-like chemotaxis protein
MSEKAPKSEELLTLRILLVGTSVGEATLWAQGAGRASVPIQFHRHDPARSALPSDGADIFVIDGNLSPDVSAGVVAAARNLKPSPLVLTCGHVNGQRPPGIDGVLPRPKLIEDARRLADLCVRARLPKRVLIVDDSSTMRSIVRKILSASRFQLETEEAFDGETALAQVRSGRFGLVFVDYNMPCFNGIDTLKEIKRQREHVAVVLITSSLDSGLAQRAIAAGAFAFLKKPFYPADIDALLERYFGLNG